MSRKNELLKLAGDDAALIELVPKMLFLEKRLEELKKAVCSSNLKASNVLTARFVWSSCMRCTGDTAQSLNR